LLFVFDVATVQIIHRVSFGKGYTNNEAEYMTLIAALEYIIKKYNVADIILHIVGDSELVRNQIGTIIDKVIFSDKSSTVLWIDVWQVKKKHLEPLRNKARELLQQFKSFTYEHVPRKKIVEVLGH
jgi:ribonuclease HI